jgi:hypothetical protein
LIKGVPYLGAIASKTNSTHTKIKEADADLKALFPDERALTSFPVTVKSATHISFASKGIGFMNS